MTKLIGIIPAAGKAMRLPFLPFSKELYPIKTSQGLDPNPSGETLHPIIDLMVNRMKIADANKFLIIISKEKVDILKHLASGEKYACQFSYLIQENQSGLPDALSLANDWLEEDSLVIFGMPDTFFEPKDAFKRIVEDHIQTKADVTLGLFPTEKPEKYGMVGFDRKGNFLTTVDKPTQTTLRYLWGIACWNKCFSNFMTTYLKENNGKHEIVLSSVFMAAHTKGIRIRVVPFEAGKYTDIGTLDDLLAV